MSSILPSASILRSAFPSTRSCTPASLHVPSSVLRTITTLALCALFRKHTFASSHSSQSPAGTAVLSRRSAGKIRTGSSQRSGPIACRKSTSTLRHRWHCSRRHRCAEIVEAVFAPTVPIGVALHSSTSYVTAVRAADGNNRLAHLPLRSYLAWPRKADDPGNAPMVYQGTDTLCRRLEA